MNLDQAAGQWHQMTGRLKSAWGRLTHDDLKNIAGTREVLVGKLQERYGVLKRNAEKQMDAWIARLSTTGDKATSADPKPQLGPRPN